MGFHIHFDTISMRLPIVSFKGSQVYFSELSRVVLILAAETELTLMKCSLCCISSGSSLFAKVPVWGYSSPVYKGLKSVL